MTVALQQTSQTVSSLRYAFSGLGFGPGAEDDGAVEAPGGDVLSEASKVAERAAVVVDALREAVDVLRSLDRNTLRGVRGYQRLGHAHQTRGAAPGPAAGRTVEAETRRIGEARIEGAGFSASLVRALSISVGPDGRTATSHTFGEISLEIDDFEIGISFNQTAELDEKSGTAEAARFGRITISGTDFEATLGFEQTLELGPDGPSVSSGRFAEFSIKADGIEAELAFGKVAGFDPSGIFVEAGASARLVQETEGGTAAIEVLRQFAAYLGRDRGSSDQSLLSVG